MVVTALGQGTAHARLLVATEPCFEQEAASTLGPRTSDTTAVSSALLRKSLPVPKTPVLLTDFTPSGHRIVPVVKHVELHLGKELESARTLL